MATEKEALAGLTVLVAIAKADGVLAPEEIRALDEAAGAADLGIDVEALVETPLDLDDALATIQDDPMRRRVYVAAAAMALADRVVAPEEDALLAHLRAVWGIGEKESAEARRLALFASPPSEVARPSSALGAEDTIRRFALIAAAFGDLSSPNAPDLAIVVLQRALVEEVVAAHGRPAEREEIAEILSSTVGLTALHASVVSVLKLVPLWGASVGAAGAFATTWALGTSVDRALTEGGALEGEALRQRFVRAKIEGKSYYEAHRAEIEAGTEAKKARVTALGADLVAGKIDEADLLRRLRESDD